MWLVAIWAAGLAEQAGTDVAAAASHEEIFCALCPTLSCCPVHNCIALIKNTNSVSGYDGYATQDCSPSCDLCISRGLQNSSNLGDQCWAVMHSDAFGCILMHSDAFGCILMHVKLQRTNVTSLASGCAPHIHLWTVHSQCVCMALKMLRRPKQPC